MRRIIYSRAALRKLESIHNYISEALKSPKAATRVAESIIYHISLLKEGPFIGPKLSSQIDRVPERFLETRFLICDKHIIVYEPKETEVMVLAIYHSSEDVFGRILSEL